MGDLSTTCLSVGGMCPGVAVDTSVGLRSVLIGGGSQDRRLSTDVVAFDALWRPSASCPKRVDWSCVFGAMVPDLVLAVCCRRACGVGADLGLKRLKLEMPAPMGRPTSDCSLALPNLCLRDSRLTRRCLKLIPVVVMRMFSSGLRPPAGRLLSSARSSA